MYNQDNEIQKLSNFIHSEFAPVHIKDYYMFDEMGPEEKTMRERFKDMWLGNYITSEEYKEIRQKVNKKLEKK